MLRTVAATAICLSTIAAHEQHKAHCAAHTMKCLHYDSEAILQHCHLLYEFVVW
jgi:hypothetical protein